MALLTLVMCSEQLLASKIDSNMNSRNKITEIVAVS